MQLTVRDIANLFKVPQKTVYRWIKEQGLPSSQVHGQYRFNRAEVLDWATIRKFQVPSGFLMQPDENGAALPSLLGALEAGGVFHGIEGADKPSVFRAIVAVMPLPKDVDRELLWRMLLAREALQSTGVGDSIAIPHVRNPIVLHVARPSATLCFLARPLDFDALDGKPVQVLFTLVSTTVRTHLHLLARLAFALRQPAFKNTVLRQANAQEIFKAIEKIENQLPASRAAADKGTGI